MAQLKDFQRATVDTVVERFYGSRSAPQTDRFLVADEVGLGKTLVARGVIARTIEHLQNTVKRIDIVYVCSNAQIAKQNVRRLHTQEEGHLEVTDRLTMLPVTARDLARNPVNVVSFTPGTSFDLKGGAGQARERAVLRMMLREAWGHDLFKSQGSYRIFQGGVRVLNRFKARCHNVVDEHRRHLDASLTASFATDLAQHDQAATEGSRPTLVDRFHELVDVFGHARPQTGWHWKETRKRSELMGDLRDLLARACLNALEPDLIILDEFQRFKHLLAPPGSEGFTPAAELAHELFSYVDDEARTKARVLLLSATPYKMLTASGDSDDDHHADFVDTVDFLLEHDESAVEALREGLRDLRQGLLQVGLDGGNAARDAKGRVEAVLRRVMVRTERLGATSDRSGMLATRPCDGLELWPADVASYVAGARLSRDLGVYDPIDFWLSAPHLLNFMDGYKIAEAFEDRDVADGASLAPLAEASGLIDWPAVRAFRPTAVENARLRWLIDDVVGRGAWQLLWVPPSLLYVEPAGPYADPALRGFTKRLIFSSWTMVPKAIATQVTYAIERRRVAASGEPAFANTAEGRQGHARPLTFTVSDGRISQMPVFAMLYPSVVLAREGDPLTLARPDDGTRLSVPTAEAQVAERLRHRLDAMRREMSPSDVEPTAPSGRADERWYWVAPLWLDRMEDRDATSDFHSSSVRLVKAFAGADPAVAGDRFRDHVDHAWEVLYWDYAQLGPMPDDLAEVLARVALAGPGVCGLRALARVSGRPVGDGEVRRAACRVAWGIRGLFNGPEVIELVRALSGSLSEPWSRSADEPYWRRILDYSLAGNLQAVLDEFAHVLAEARGHLDPSTDEAVHDIAGAIHDAAELRTVNYGVRRIETDGGRIVANESDRLRANAALRLSDEQAEDGTYTRSGEVRDAFNSPFQPFVLATTSAGQEGLDFHQFCHAIVHWNLPGNPVDLEQREGRVHRYKGHAVRRNLARVYGSVGLAAEGDPWAAIFAAASADRPPDQNEIRPYWVYAPEALDGDAARIERFVPAFALSRDRAQADALQRSVALYRVAFGQPRQDDLLAYLSGQIGPAELERLADDLRIDLGPRPPSADPGRVAIH
jgi:hypothetical protein